MPAAHTVRTTPEQQLRKLIASAYDADDQNVETLVKGRVLEGHETATMLRFKAREVANMLKAMSVGIGGFAATPPMVMGASELVAWRQLVRGAVQSIMATGLWRPSGRLDLSVVLLREREGTVRRLFTSNDRRLRQNWRTVTIVLLSALLERAGGQLRRCAAGNRCVEEGGRVMVRQGRSEYCSAQCSQRVRSATHYRTHRAAVRQRRMDRYAEAALPARVTRRRR